MLDFDRSAISDINRVLSAVRAGLDAGSYPSNLASRHLDDFQAAYLRFEQIRFAFRARTSRTRQLAEKDYVAALNELRGALLGLTEDRAFMGIAELVKFRPLNMTRSPSMFRIHPDLAQPALSVAAALALLGEGLEHLRLPPASDLTDEQQQFAELVAIVPTRQGIGPAKFNVVAGRLVLAPQPAVPAPEDRANAASAKAELMAQNQRIIEHLINSNCDRRLIENVGALHERLVSDHDIIRLGLTNMACEVMRTHFAGELPEALSAMLMSQTLGISMYVAQFPEWHQFTERAAGAELEPEDAPHIRRAMSDIIGRLESAPEVADPEVPRTLRALNELLGDPGRTSKRALFAAWRTVENLLITIFNYGSDIIRETAKKTAERLSDASSRVIVVLLAAAVAGATPIAEVARRVPESAWIQKAVEIVRDQILRLPG